MSSEDFVIIEHSFFEVDGVQLSVDSDGGTMVTEVKRTLEGEEKDGPTTWSSAPDTYLGSMGKVKLTYEVTYYLSKTQLEIRPSNTKHYFAAYIPGGRYFAFEGIITSNSPEPFTCEGDPIKAVMKIMANPSTETYALAPTGSYS